MTDDERAIRGVVDAWMAATKAGDPEALLALMTDDVVFMTVGREPFGKEVFAQAAEAQKVMKVDGHSDVRELQVMGDWAYVRNYVSVKVTITGVSGPMTREGWTLTILKRGEDGKWRMTRDANLMPPPRGTH